jgi:hypothetical protein
MSYLHDVFISYKRQELWTPWTRDHFKKLLKAYLQPDLGVEPDIFVDERLQVGADWVDSLGDHLAKSKVLVAIFSADYFGSDWCIHELDLMLARSVAASEGQTVRAPLIIPVIVHDGDLIPDEAKRIQPAKMNEFWLTHLCEDSLLYQQFTQAMKKLSVDVAKTINNAPPFQDVWVTNCIERFNAIYDASTQGNLLDPEQFEVKRQTAPTTSPKLKI